MPLSLLPGSIHKILLIFARVSFHYKRAVLSHSTGIFVCRLVVQMSFRPESIIGWLRVNVSSLTRQKIGHFGDVYAAFICKMPLSENYGPLMYKKPLSTDKGFAEVSK